jgi:uncharacterized protein (UPF0262 family)
MPLTRIEIDARTWDTAARARRTEWLAAIHEMLADWEIRFLEGADSLTVTVTAQGTALELRDFHGDAMASCDVPRSALSVHVTEYIDVVTQIYRVDQGAGSARLEALDMAKKLAHDDAARTLRRLCRPLGADHATCRRLWTLLFALRVDTTKLGGARGHRAVR